MKAIIKIIFTKKKYENGLQLPDFYLFTFIFYLLHEKYRLNLF